MALALTGMAGCGEEPDERTQAPRVALIGATTAEPMPDGLAVHLTRDGIWLAGRRSTLADLERAIRARLGPADRNAKGWVTTPLVIAASAEVPFAATQWVMSTAANVGFRHLRFAVGHAGSKVAWSFPYDFPEPSEDLPPPSFGKPRNRLRVKLFGRTEDRARTGMAWVERTVREHLAQRGADTPVEIDFLPPTGARVPHDYVMEVLDAVRRAGATTIDINAGPWLDPDASVDEALAALHAKERIVPLVMIGDGEIGPPD
jgi:biopolymer transport protein ExbD